MPLPDGKGLLRDAWLVFAVALLIRIAYVFFARVADPYFGWSARGFDQNVFQTWAEKILHGDWLLREVGLFYYSSIFAYFSALIYKLFGWQNFMAVHLAQALIGAGACGLMTVLARTWLARRWALAAAACYALAAPVLYYEQALLIEGLVLAGYVGLLWGLRTGTLALIERDLEPDARRFKFHYAWLRLALGGLCGAFAMVGRGNAMLVLLAAVAWCLWPGRRGERPWATWLRHCNWKPAGAFLLGMLLIIAPLLARNYAVAHKLTLGMTNGKVMFYLGNAADANGTFAYSPRFEQAQKLAGSDPAIYRKMFLEDLSTAPGAILANQFRKTFFLLGTNDYPDNLNFQMAQGFLWPLRWSPVQWEWLAPLGLVGLALTLLGGLPPRHGWGLLWLFAAVFAISIIIIIPVGRYRLPIVIAWALGSGAALEWFVAQWRAGRRERPLWAATAFGLLVLVLWPWQGNSPLLPGRLIRPNDFMNGLSASLTSNNPAAADRIIELANRTMPEGKSTWLSYRLEFAEKNNDPAVLLRTANEMAKLPNLTPQSAYKLTLAFIKLGQTSNAQALVQQLQKAMPNDPTVQQLMRQLHMTP
jgi:hypothetical protein